MACRNENYNPRDFYRINSMIKASPDKWEAFIRNKYKPAVADEIVNLITSGAFTKDYGRASLKQQLSSTIAVLENGVEVSSLKNRYATDLGRHQNFGFNQMQNKFLSKLTECVLINPKTYQMINANDVSETGQTFVNQALFDYKLELIKNLRAKLFQNEKFDYEYDGSDESFTTLLAQTLSEFQKRYIKNREGLSEVWDDYFILKYFDSLLIDFADFIRIKPKWRNVSKKGIDMYEYLGPHVNYDTSYNPDEFASAEQYSSAYLKALMEYFKKIEPNGKESVESITFDGLNSALCDLKEFLVRNPSRDLRFEIYKGENADWDYLINSFINSKQASPDTIRILKGLQRLLSDKPNVGINLDNKIKQVLRQEANRIIRYEFLGFRKNYDGRIRRNIVTQIRLKDHKIDVLKGSLARSIRYRVWKSRNQPLLYESLKSDLKINVDQENKQIILSGYFSDGSNLVLAPFKATVGDGTKKSEYYNFKYYKSTKNGLIEFEANEIDETKWSKLISTLLQQPLPQNYKQYLGSSVFATTTLFDTFKNVIGITLSASESDLFDFTFRFNDVELELPNIYYRNLEVPAKFIGLINGISTNTMSKNGLGNDLPNYQTISAIHLAQQAMD